MINLLNTQIMAIPKKLISRTDAALNDWATNSKIRKLWQSDSSMWTGKDESQWLGWLTIAQEQLERLPSLEGFAEEIQSAGFTDILVLGMGGSSLCPEVISKTFNPADNYPKLHVLDSTDPEQIKEIESQVNLEKTLFVISSKSGSTLEPNIFYKYFFEKLRQKLGDISEVARHFIAITDPGSPLEKLAHEKHFRTVFHGKTSIGGRYSALSDFGMVPAALIGIKMRDFLSQTISMVDSCKPNISLGENPGVGLGLLLGISGSEGRNKITFFCSRQIKHLGIWLEQLLAESTGKEGKGLIPITGEAIADPKYYDNDRVFVYLKVEADNDEKFEAALLKLQDNGHPIIRIVMKDIYGLGQEFFRWEMATAIAGTCFKINPFDQPDVEASKDATRQITDEFEKTGKLDREKPVYEEEGIQVFANEGSSHSQKNSSLKEVLKVNLSKIKRGDYFGILAYLPMDLGYETQMQQMRLAVRDSKKVATCLEFGPRFLHSTGQVYKGGPNTGVFLEVTGENRDDLSIPGLRATFGVVEMAQARGDFQVLTSQKNRRALRVHLMKNVRENLAKLSEAFFEALN
jgi:transaldolase/glucose-6-phosphate isomerase